MQTQTAAAAALQRWSAAPAPTRVRLTPLAWRVWPPRRAVAPLEMPALGAFGEILAVEYLRRYADEPDAQRIASSELPVDVLTARYAVEVKAGLSSNGRQAQQWRLTFSDAKGTERRTLAALSASERTAWFRRKQARIVERKTAVLDEVRRLAGRPIEPVTITVIVDAQRRDVDLFWFSGWHQRLGWNTPETRAAYRGTFHVQRASSDVGSEGRCR